MRRCIDCGKPIENGTKICPHCGYHLYPDYLETPIRIKKCKKKVIKEKPLFSGAEVYTALNTDDVGFIGLMLTKFL